MKIVCLGDSFTSGYGVMHEQCWVSLTASETGFELINRGIPGDTTGGMAARLEHDILEHDVLQHAPDAALIIGGANDLMTYGSIEISRSNYISMTDTLIACGIQPVIGAPNPCDVRSIQPPWSLFYDFRYYNDIMEEFTEWQKAFAEENSFRQLDIFNGFSKELEGLGENEISSLYLDGLHLKPQGHRIVADIVSAELSRMFKQDR